MDKKKSFTITDEQNVLTLFENCQFPRHEWNHRAHLTVAYLYLCQFTLAETIDKLRQGIIAYIGEAQAHAYHETITQVWTRLIHAAMEKHGPGDSAWHFFNRHSYLLDKRFPQRFYSHEHLMSPQARRSFVEPDLLPLSCEYSQEDKGVRF
jgi:hypothetical protein